MEFKKIKLPFQIKKAVLALGPQTKNSLCFAQGNFAYLSRTHSDLSNPEDFLSFERVVKYFLKKNPEIIAYDLHPEYRSTKYALNLKPHTYDLIPVQHHHAHIVSCMAENGLSDKRVIGVAFDGTGLGSDNRLWGGEFFICDYRNFKRAAHLKEIPLLGAEKAIREPLRVAAAWLYLIYKDKFLNLEAEVLKKMERRKWRVLKNMYLSGFNAPLTSSMGRLFDAAGSLILAKDKVSKDAELAIELEGLAARYKCQKPQAASYKFRVVKQKNDYILDPTRMWIGIIKDLKSKEAKEKIAYCFHLTVARMIRDICLILRKEHKINKVILSGGVFQNNLLLKPALDLLYKEDFRVFTHRELSCNDSGISLGQAVIANFSR